MKIEHIQKKDKAALPNVNEKTGFSRKKLKEKVIIEENAK